MNLDNSIDFQLSFTPPVELRGRFQEVLGPMQTRQRQTQEISERKLPVTNPSKFPGRPSNVGSIVWARCLVSLVAPGRHVCLSATATR